MASNTGSQSSRREELVGTTVAGRYTLSSFLARGGMGAVFVAVDHQTGDCVAIKILEREASEPLNRRRFFNEATLSMSIEHENVVRVLDYGLHDGLCYIAMEYLDGETLSGTLRRMGRLAPALALQVADQIAAGLVAAHEAGFVHRDLKPSNVFVTGFVDDVPQIKLLDFGLAKRTNVENGLTVSGVFMGSPTWMSPEQIRTAPIGPGTDIYNLGLMLFRMMVGRPPFQEDDVMSVLAAHLTQRAPKLREAEPRLSVPDELEWFVANCLEKRAEDRLPSMAACRDMIGSLQRALDGETMEPEWSLHGLMEEVPAPMGWRVTTVAVATTLLVLFLAMGLVSTLSG